MLKVESKLLISDNSDAQVVKIICFLKSTRTKVARLGDIILVVIQKRKRRKNLIKRDIQYALITNTCSHVRRLNGNYIRFKYNKAILLKKDLDLVATRFKGVIPLEAVLSYEIENTNVMKKTRFFV